MNRNLLSLALLAIVACSSSKSAESPTQREPGKPELGRTVMVYEVVDRGTRTRIGFVEKKDYNSGRILYWVRDLKRRTDLGYIDANGCGYKYVWVGGQRAKDAENLGVDTLIFNVRTILGHETMIDIFEITEQKLLDEITKKAAAAAAPQEKAPAEGCEAAK